MSLCFYLDLINRIYVKEFTFKFVNIRSCGLVKGSNPREVATMISFFNSRHNFF